MAQGKVKFFNSQKGFGFIQPNDGGPDVFVHISAVERAGMRTLNEGQELAYDVVSERRMRLPRPVPRYRAVYIGRMCVDDHAAAHCVVYSSLIDDRRPKWRGSQQHVLNLFFLMWFMKTALSGPTAECRAQALVASMAMPRRAP
jgi:cold shock protein